MTYTNLKTSECLKCFKDTGQPFWNFCKGCIDTTDNEELKRLAVEDLKKSNRIDFHESVMENPTPKLSNFIIFLKSASEYDLKLRMLFLSGIR